MSLKSLENKSNISDYTSTLQLYACCSFQKIPQNLDASALLGLWSWAGPNTAPFLLRDASPSRVHWQPPTHQGMKQGQDHPREPSRSRRTWAQRKSWQFHSYCIIGKRSDSPRLSWKGAPGPWAGVGGGWAGAVSALRVLTASFIGKYLKNFISWHTWYMR